MIEIILPYPPSVNHYKSIGRTIKTASGKTFQHRFNSPKTTAFYYYVYRKVKETQMDDLGEAIVSIAVEVYPPDRRKRDLDNVLKVLLDSLQYAGVYKDDNQVCRLLIERKEVKKDGQVIVRIENIVKQML